MCKFLGLDPPETLGALVASRGDAEAILNFAQIWARIRLRFYMRVPDHPRHVAITITSRQKRNAGSARAKTDLGFVGWREDTGADKSIDARLDDVVAGRQALTPGADVGRDSGAYC